MTPLADQAELRRRWETHDWSPDTQRCRRCGAHDGEIVNACPKPLPSIDKAKGQSVAVPLCVGFALIGAGLYLGGPLVAAILFVLGVALLFGTVAEDEA